MTKAVPVSPIFEGQTRKRDYSSIILLIVILAIAAVTILQTSVQVVHAQEMPCVYTLTNPDGKVAFTFNFSTAAERQEESYLAGEDVRYFALLLAETNYETRYIPPTPGGVSQVDIWCQHHDGSYMHAMFQPNTNTN